MKMIQILLITLVVVLTGCASRNTDITGDDGKLKRSLTDKGFMISSMNQNVNECLKTVAAKYANDTAKLKQQPLPVANSTDSVALEAVKALRDVSMALIGKEQAIELARLGIAFSSAGVGNCSELGYANMVIEKKRINHETARAIVPGVLKTALSVFGIIEGRKVLLGTLDRVKANNTAAEGGTIFDGNSNTYNPDNRVNSCIEDGTCVSPIEEEVMPDPEQVGELPAPDPVIAP